jgi:hypothetical protein
VTETYSLAITGCLADNPQASRSETAGLYTVGDSVARHGSIRNACMLGTPFLAKGPDGGVAWYTYDAERSRAGGPLVLLRVSP